MWKLGDNGDLVFKNGITELDSKAKEVAQRLQLKLSLFNGDYELRKEEGIDWYETYNLEGQLGKKLKYNSVKQQIIDLIEDDEDVETITYIDFDYNNVSGKLNIMVDMILKNGESLSI